MLVKRPWVPSVVGVVYSAGCYAMTDDCPRLGNGVVNRGMSEATWAIAGSGRLFRWSWQRRELCCGAGADEGLVDHGYRSAAPDLEQEDLAGGGAPARERPDVHEVGD